MTNNVSCRRWLIATFAALALQSPVAMAEIVTTQDITAPSPADAERAKVEAFLEQATVAQRLQTMGVDSIAAEKRVAAMSQEEVHTLAQRIDAMPAGGNFSNSEIIIGILALILLVIIL